MKATFAPQHLLCLVDLSPASPVVLSWARLVANHFHPDLEILHADWPGESKLSGEEEEASWAQVQMRKTELAGELERIADAVFVSGVPYRVLVEVGHPVQVVLQYLGAHVPDLIVMGSHGEDGAAHVLLGSVAENLVRVANCPILIAKGNQLARGQKQLQRVVCPTNLGDFSMQCLDAACAIAAVTGASVDSVLSLEEAHVSSEQGRTRLHEWIPAQLRERCSITETILRGDPAEQLIGLLRREASDLVVVGAEHRPFFEYTTLGRTTEKVMRFSPCTVVVVPQKV
ncbi:MAG TPA: universal stress protein [Terriglobales bacterium]|nr:universal stress protein [Terriglobales bacterium]